MKIGNALKLIFSESVFLKAELHHIELKHKAGEAYQPAEEFREEALSRIKAKRRNLLKSALWIALLVLLGGIIATILNSTYPLSWFWIRIVRGFSVFLLAWAVWSKIGDVETFKGETLLELTSQYIYKFSYSAGILIGSVALFLEGTEST